MQEEQWWFMSDDAVVGPVSKQLLLDLVREGPVTSETLVSKDRGRHWTACRKAFGGELGVGAPHVEGSHAPVDSWPPTPDSAWTSEEARGGAKEEWLPPRRVRRKPRRRVRYAGFWIRAAAVLIDGVTLGAISLTTLLVASMVLAAAQESGFETGPRTEVFAFWVWQLVSFVLQAAYFIGMESSRYGATIGKRAVGIRILDESGGLPTVGQVTGRFFGRCLSGLTLGLGYLTCLGSKKRQTLHDMMSNCVVIYGAGK